MSKKIWFIFLLIGCSETFGQDLKTRNVIVVTLDGFRWQELFKGADSALLFNNKHIRDQRVVKDFWHASIEQRRESLLPFFWNVIGQQGQLYGNRDYGNQVNCSNPHWFSYPGYSEMLVGFVEKSVRSNNRFENPNPTVLEYIHQQPGFENKVAAFTTWDVFPYILREQKSGIHISAHNTEMPCAVQWTSSQSPCVDDFTFYHAFEYLKEKRPRVLFISLDETDAHSHGGRYAEYLKAAHRTDEMLQELWQWVQSQDDYRDKTTLIVTTDHGRGTGKNTWKSHGRLIFRSGQIWMAVLGPDTPALGEIKTAEQHFQKQVAATTAAFLCFDYTNNKPVGAVLQSAFYNKFMLSKVYKQNNK